MNRRMVGVILIVLVAIFGWQYINTPNGATAKGATTMTESQLYSTLRDQPNTITKLEFDGTVVHVYTAADKFTDVQVPDEGARTELKKLANEKNVAYDTKPEERPSAFMTILFMLLPLAIPVLIIVLLFKFMKGMTQAGQKQMEFAKHKGKRFSPAVGKVMFSDVTGQVEGKQELEEIVHFLKEPAVFKEAGAKIPSGVLLIGPPGTGKTLLARAVAGEAGVPFFSIAGSEFVEMFVGVGASRVRDLFATVKAAAPAILFIDEIDGVGRKRGGGHGGSNDEREQTLNQILVEMDGFEIGGAPVIVIAATNRPDVLDPALLRPGRFSRHVVVDLPDNEGRLATLKLYLKGKPVVEGLDLEFFARATQGMSQADIANICNEAALLAARRKVRGIFDGLFGRGQAVTITAADLDTAISKQQFGPERRSMQLSVEHKENVGVHEAGHAVAHWKKSGGEMPRKITIVPTTKAAGYVQLLLKANQMTQTRDECITFIVMALAGRTAQEKLLKRTDTGASNDFAQAWDIARRMVAEWGWSELGVIHAPLGEQQQFFSQAPSISQRLMEQIEEQTRKIISACQKEADEIIEQYGPAILHVKDILLERETILGPEFVEVMEKVAA